MTHNITLIKIFVALTLWFTLQLPSKSDETLNLRSAYGAYGDFQSLPTLPVSITVGSKTLIVSGAFFSTADIGKRVIIDGAGPLRSLGYVASVPVTASGSYTATPTVSFSGLGPAAAGVVGAAMMAAQSARVSSGGSGCSNGLRTFTLVGGNANTPTQVTGTVTGGVLSGSLTLATPGSYQPGTNTTLLLATNPVATIAPFCTSAPTIKVAWGIGSIFMAGQGMNVALSGVTASLASGNGLLGTPVVSQVVTPLSARIVSVTDAQNVVLDTAATTAISASTQGFGYGHEDTAALEAAKVAACAKFKTGFAPPQIYVPMGYYLIGSTSSPSTQYQCPMQIIGDGPLSTQFKMDPAMTGPLFSESEAWGGYAVSGFVNAAGPTGPLDFATRSSFRNFSIIGDTSVMNEQESIVLYDRNDRVNIDNIMGSYIWGSHVRVGSAKYKPQAYMRESLWKDIYCNYCGSPVAPVYDFNTVGTGDSTNTNSFFGLNSVPSQGICVFIHNENSVKATTYLNFYDTRCEGGVGANFSPDALIQVGDEASIGKVTDVNFFGVRSLGTPINTSGIKISGQKLANAPQDINFFGLTTNGAGKGINVQATAGMLNFEGVQNSSNDFGLTIGSSTLVAAPIRISAEGNEYGWTKNIDSTSLASVLSPIYMLGNGSFTVNTHNRSESGGNLPSNNSVDLQTARTAASQTTTGQFSFAQGGYNSAQGAYDVVFGARNNAQGSFSFVAGQNAADRGRSGTGYVYSGGQFINTADAQTVLAIVFRASLTFSTSSAVSGRATSDGNLRPNSASNDINNIPAGLHYHMQISASCTGHTSTSTPVWASWDVGAGDLDRRANSVTYVGSFNDTAKPTRSSGILSDATLAVSADNDLYGLNVTFTLPKARTAGVVHCVAKIANTEEVQ